MRPVTLYVTVGCGVWPVRVVGLARSFAEPCGWHLPTRVGKTGGMTVEDQLPRNRIEIDMESRPGLQ